ncbi:hypothetical protein SRABI134_01188 [Peribacillus sp. Bi134]|nr:hypothetical protein SRABI134_01188 [Peribacillus sp. Bi134]
MNEYKAQTSRVRALSYSPLILRTALEGTQPTSPVFVNLIRGCVPSRSMNVIGITSSVVIGLSSENIIKDLNT